MGDTSVSITPGSGASIDAHSQPGGDLRQVVVIGDPVSPDVAAAGGAATATGAGMAVRAGRTTTAPTPARVASAITSTLLLAANAARLGVVIHNDSSADLFVKFGTAASATSYVYKVPSQGHLVLPEPGQPLYTGVIHGIWSAAAGAATVNELT